MPAKCPTIATGGPACLCRCLLAKDSTLQYASGPRMGAVADYNCITQWYLEKTRGTPFEYTFVDEVFSTGSARRIDCKSGPAGYDHLCTRAKNEGDRRAKNIGSFIMEYHAFDFKSILILILISFIVAAPVGLCADAGMVAGFCISDRTFWRSIYVNRCEHGWSLLITSNHSLKASFMNPVDVLKDE